MMQESGFVIDHEHNHCGQCWWEMRTAGSTGGHAPVGEVAGGKDVRLLPQWRPPGSELHCFNKANDPDQKMDPSPPRP